MSDILTKLIIFLAILAAIVGTVFYVVGHIFIFLIDFTSCITSSIESALGVVPSTIWGIAGTALLLILVLFTGAVAFATALRAIRAARCVDVSSKNILLFNDDNTTAISFAGANITSKIVEQSNRLTIAEQRILEKMRRRPQLENQNLKLLKGGE